MADVKWIKFVTNMFNNRKIKIIETMPERDTIIVIWCKLLCLAGEINDGGLVYFTKDKPYTNEMLAGIFDRPLNTVKLALLTFADFGMTEYINDFIKITNWEKYQAQDKLEQIREQNRKRVAEYRTKKKSLLNNNELECNVTRNVTVTQCNALDKDIDIEEDIDNICITNINITNTSEFVSLTPNENALISLILNNKKYFNIFQKDIDYYQDLYPAVNVLQELKLMKGWLDSNPSNRKTEKGIKAFITRWLGKKQDKAPRVQADNIIRDGFEGFEGFETL